MMHDREMAEAAAGHGLHHLVDRIVGVAGHDIAGHDLPRLELHRLDAMGRERAHQIAFGDDADDRALVVEDQDRADAADTELLGDLGHRGARRHREDETALLRENVGDEHGSPLRKCGRR
jgi:hypothetical protein